MTPPPGGIYRISRYGVFEESQILSRYGDEAVTVVGPNVVPQKDQEWRLEVLEDKIAIQHPVDSFPSRSLSYEGEPEVGKRIVLGPLSDFLTREWRLIPAPQPPSLNFEPYLISVPGKEELTINVSTAKVYPPQLVLAVGLNSWVFERLNDAK